MAKILVFTILINVLGTANNKFYFGKHELLKLCSWLSKLGNYLIAS